MPRMTTATEKYERRMKAVDDLQALAKSQGIPMTRMAEDLGVDVRSIDYWFQRTHLPAGKKLVKVERYIKRRSKA